MSPLLETLESRRLLAGQIAIDGPPTEIVFLPNGVLGSKVIASVVETTDGFNGSAFVTKSGTLVIEGTSGADNISVAQDGSKIKYRAFVQGHHYNVSANASQIKRVLIEAGSGNDKVIIDSALAKRCTVVGGNGNDDITGNYGATLIGGAGNDRLTAPPRTNYDVDNKIYSIDEDVPRLAAVLCGGLGDDTLTGDRFDDYVGGKGNDHAGETFNFHSTTQPVVVGADDFINQIQDASGIETFAGKIEFHL